MVGDGFVAAREQFAVIELGKALPWPDRIAHLDMKPFHDAREPRAHAHLGADAWFDHAGGLDDLSQAGRRERDGLNRSRGCRRRFGGRGLRAEESADDERPECED